MVSVPPVVGQNPIATVLTLGATLAGVATAGVALTGGEVRLVIRLLALTVVLGVFAAGFWAGVLGERYV